MASYGYLPSFLNLKENDSERDWCLRVSNSKHMSLFRLFLQHQRNARFPFLPVALSAADPSVFCFSECVALMASDSDQVKVSWRV